MQQLKPKAQHEQFLADVDQALIIEHLLHGRELDITKIAVTLARECDLFVHFLRLWQLRVAPLEVRLSEERYTKNIYQNRRTLYRTF